MNAGAKAIIQSMLDDNDLWTEDYLFAAIRNVATSAHRQIEAKELIDGYDATSQWDELDLDLDRAASKFFESVDDLRKILPHMEPKEILWFMHTLEKLMERFWLLSYVSKTRMENTDGK